MMSKYKTVIVTGASSGIGAAIARKFCLNGATVYALARNSTMLNDVRKSIPNKYKTNLIIKKCDVLDRTQVNSIFKDIFKKEKVDLVISNAGIGYNKLFTDYTYEEIDTVLNTNILGAINVIKSSLTHRNDKPLQIVCTSSLAGKIGFPRMSIYSVSKFGVEGLVESLRNEFKPKDVLFTILRPGITRTPFFKKAGMLDFEKSVKELKNFYTPESVADIFYKKLSPTTETIVVGNDKYFLAILPIIPFRQRFRILNLINKL